MHPEQEGAHVELPPDMLELTSAVPHAPSHRFHIGSLRLRLQRDNAQQVLVYTLTGFPPQKSPPADFCGHRLFFSAAGLLYEPSKVPQLLADEALDGFAVLISDFHGYSGGSVFALTC